MTALISGTWHFFTTPAGFTEISFSKDIKFHSIEKRKKRRDASTKLITTLFLVIYLLRSFNTNVLHFLW